MALRIYDGITDEERDATQADIDDQTHSIRYLALKQQIIALIADPGGHRHPDRIPCANHAEHMRRIKMVRDIFLHGNVQKLAQDYPVENAGKLTQ